MKKSSAVILALGVIAGAAAAYGAKKYAVDYFTRIALDRKPPKVSPKGAERLTGIKNTQGSMKEFEASSEKLKNRNLHTYEVKSRDGIKLTAHILDCEKPERIIIAMHGWRSSWYRDFGAISEFFAENGCCVFFAEERAQGSSGGDYMGFGLKERYDCLEWVRAANEYCGGKLPVYLYGISMGGTAVLMSGGFKLPESVHGIISDCAFTSPRDIWKHVIEHNIKLPYALFDRSVNDVCLEKIHAKPDSYSTVKAMEECEKPVLLIHGGDDHFVPTEMSYRNYKACKSPKELLIIPGADHGMSYYTDKEKYEKALIGFWKKHE